MESMMDQNPKLPPLDRAEVLLMLDHVIQFIKPNRAGLEKRLAPGGHVQYVLTEDGVMKRRQRKFENVQRRDGVEGPAEKPMNLTRGGLVKPTAHPKEIRDQLVFGYLKKDPAVIRCLPELAHALPAGAIEYMGDLSRFPGFGAKWMEPWNYDVWKIGNPAHLENVPAYLVFGKADNLKDGVAWIFCRYLEDSASESGASMPMDEDVRAVMKATENVAEVSSGWNCDLVQMRQILPIAVHFLRGWREKFAAGAKPLAPKKVAPRKSPKSRKEPRTWKTILRERGIDLVEEATKIKPEKSWSGNKDKLKMTLLHRKVVDEIKQAKAKVSLPSVETVRREVSRLKKAQKSSKKVSKKASK